jgi:hypothetical protein
MQPQPLCAYLVKTKDARTYVEPIMDDGTGPIMHCWPMAPVVAESPSAAKALFLREYGGRNSGVETDDYVNLRVTKLTSDGLSLPRGVRDRDESLWALVKA